MPTPPLHQKQPKSPKAPSPSFWTTDRLLEATGGHFVVPPPHSVALGTLTFDSRSVAPGDIFIAIKGHTLDGHDFLANAMEQGAACLIATQAPMKTPPQTFVLIVPDTQKALEDMARYARNHLGQDNHAPRASGQGSLQNTKPHVVAITGSYGKTSLKELLYHGLSTIVPTWANIKSFNNKWGVSITLANTPMDTQVGVYEVGTNQPGECGYLSKLVQPSVAVITTIGHAHRENFPTHQDLVEEKADIMAGLRPGGIVILPSDLPEFDTLRAKALSHGAANVISFGWAPGSTIQITAADTYTNLPHGMGLTIQLRVSYPHKNEPSNFTLSLPLHGDHWAVLVAAALAVFVAIHPTLPETSSPSPNLQKFLDGLTSFREPHGRGRLHTFYASPSVNQATQPGATAFTFIDQTYNANPHTMASALVSLAKFPIVPGARRIAILGEMYEIGTPEETRALHAAIAQAIDPQEIHGVITVGTMARYLHDALPKGTGGVKFAWHVDTGPEALKLLGEVVQPGDVIMAKASNAVIHKKLVDTAARNHNNNYHQALASAMGLPHQPPDQQS